MSDFQKYRGGKWCGSVLDALAENLDVLKQGGGVDLGSALVAAGYSDWEVRDIRTAVLRDSIAEDIVKQAKKIVKIYGCRPCKAVRNKVDGKCMSCPFSKFVQGIKNWEGVGKSVSKTK